MTRKLEKWDSRSSSSAFVPLGGGIRFTDVSPPPLPVGGLVGMNLSYLKKLGLNEKNENKTKYIRQVRGQTHEQYP